VKTGFVILSTGEARLLETALRAAAGEGFDAGLVVENGTSDDTATVAASFGIRLLTLAARVPYTEAMNAGLQALLGDESLVAVALLQADTFVAPGYLAVCATALAGAPAIGSVAPKLIRTIGPGAADVLAQLDAAAMSFDRRRKNSLVGHGTPATGYGRPAPAFGADGAAALWRVAALRDCAIDGGVFDENMPGWGCDADLAWRGQLFGWRSVYEPAAVVHHIRTYSPSTRASARPEDRRTQFRNRLLMIVKNDSLGELLRDLVPVAAYEIAAFGYALLVERELLGGYAEAWRRLPEARRQRRIIQARRRVRRVPFGLEPPSGS
jgi:GT2 family glycosyltransferase